MVALASGLPGYAADPALTSISPSARTNLADVDVTVILHGTTLNTPGLTVAFNVPGMDPVPVSNASQDGTTAAATFMIDSSVTGSFTVTLMKSDGTALPSVQTFDSGVVANVCVEAIGSNCILRWELDTTAVTATNSQSGSGTTPSFLTVLDYQFRSPKEPAALTQAKRSRNARSILENLSDKQKFADRLVGHLIAKAGYTQVSTANSVQSANSGNGSGSTNLSGSQISCPATNGSGSTTPQNCTAVTPQQAFVIDLAVNGGITFSRNGSGIFSVLGFQGRGQFQDLISANQVLQSGNLSYVDLTANNPRSYVGLYEGTASFHISSWNHDKAALPNGSYGNASDLLMVEFGYQYNSGLQQLVSTNLRQDTRPRYVGRFYLYPEIPNGKTHTKGVVGVEFSGGINGGPKVVQVLWGLNLSPAKLFFQ
jgi:hypothetical protein